MRAVFVDKLIKRITRREHRKKEIMYLECNLFTRKGLDKEVNEDSFLIDRFDEYSEEIKNLSFNSDTMHIFAIFDGVSTGGNGKRSSEMAVQYLKNFIIKNKNSFEDLFCFFIDKLIWKINIDLYKSFNEHGKSKWGTTMAMIIIYMDQCVLFNVGDSRIYRLMEGSLIQLSQDYTLESYKRHLGFLKQDPYISKKDSSILYQCLGKNETIEYYKYGPFTIESNDKLFMCSDGISGYLSSKNIITILNSDDKQKIYNLAEEARKAGSIDDQTGILISIS